MHIILFAHPSFLGSQSMPRYAQWLKAGLEALGHSVEVWSPELAFYKLPFPAAFKKWLGYIDQYLLFPRQVKKRLKSCDNDTLFVFADNALGPWVPLVINRPHIIHCHDFLAQQSALGLIKENPTGWTGKKYQAYIRRGFKQGKNFISVSKNTRTQLHGFLAKQPAISEVVYNALLLKFDVVSKSEARAWLQLQVAANLTEGYIVHVGGNQWYKNRPGVVAVYNAWRRQYTNKLPLLLIGAAPDNALQQAYETSAFKNDIHFLTGKNDEFVWKAYAGASTMLFPSLAEGFGWPIAEAMAAGTVVVTTGEAPMTEVGGAAAMYIKRKPYNEDKNWADESAVVLQKLMQMSVSEKKQVIENGFENIRRFRGEDALIKIESIYRDVIKNWLNEHT